MRLVTKNGYALSDCVSVMQKAIRRNDTRRAGYFAMELHLSGYGLYAWRRVLIISAEDCAGLVTAEVKALFDSWGEVRRQMGDKIRFHYVGRVFLAKAVILLCTAAKSRDADHLANLVHEAGSMTTEEAEAYLAELDASERLDVPEYAIDCHTRKGRAMGRTRRDFFLAEDAALTPRGPSLFDADLERLRRGEIAVADRNWSQMK